MNEMLETLPRVAVPCDRCQEAAATHVIVGVANLAASLPYTTVNACEACADILQGMRA